MVQCDGTHLKPIPAMGYHGVCRKLLHRGKYYSKSAACKTLLALVFFGMVSDNLHDWPSSVQNW